MDDNDDWYSLQEEEEEENEVETHIDEDGYFYSTEETMDIVHASIAESVEEYATALLNSQQSRDILKQLTVARN